MYWQPLIFVAYLATMPLVFLAFAAIEIKLHPDKYKD